MEESRTERLQAFHPLHPGGAPERPGRDAGHYTVSVRIRPLLRLNFTYVRRDRTTVAPVSSQVKYFKGGMCSKAQFDAALSNGIPICIEDAHTSLQGEWEPWAFEQRYGPQPVTPIDCLTGKEAKGSWDVKRFFAMLGSGATLYGMLKLKVSF